ncbi:hypothetical protein SUVZ_09G1340 [Saccharomyces uvarum]|uniref:Yke4p n=1 Tax=Saccharomyces uvarum TaxID=230603 RepID=A0ABN8WVN2_SACUV|nr:hypothetical protein SUVZ_09G1340 [Saccharomyces uvarum]
MKAFQVCSYLLGMAPAVLAHGLHHNHAHGQGAEHEFKQGSVILKQESVLYPLVHFLQDYVFALGPRYNALVAILIIQFMPCLFVLVVPGLRRTDPASLTLPLLVSFSLGSLLGDVFLHIIPESLIGGGADNGMMVGVAIFLGFICFLTLDKTLRILSGGSNDDGGMHSHSHGHTHEHQDAEKKTGFNMSAYLNVISGIAHHITDGIALASSFYSSAQVGIITSIAITFHEIPHELGDFAVLLSSGFTFPQALRAQMITAFGAVVGTAIGCLINEIGGSSHGATSSSGSVSELMLPFTAGGLIYIATTSVVPQILQSSTHNSKCQEFKRWVLQLGSIFVGFAVMALMDEH